MKGAGRHYGGPGMSAFNLYSSDEKGRFSLTLAHGFDKQADADLFTEQVLLHPASNYSFSNAIALHWKSIRWVKQHAKDFDVYHGLTAFETPVRCALVAEKAGLPSVVKVAGHLSDLGPRTGWRKYWGQTQRRRKVLDRLSGVIAISSDIASELQSYGIPESKIVRIPNGVNCERFMPLVSVEERNAVRERLKLPHMPLITFLGGINKRKQPHLMVEALILLRKRGIDCHMVFTGPFDDRAYLDQLRGMVNDHRLEDFVSLLGSVSETTEILQVSDIFCLPSRLEGMPNALLEAMACALPCISTNISGVKDIVTHNVNATLVAQEPAELALALETYLGSEALRKQHGIAARERVLQSFSSKAVLDAHERLFRRIMCGQPATE